MQDKNKKEITFDEAKSLIESGEAPNTELFGFDINQLFVDVISDSHDSSTCENFLKKITSKTLVHIAIEKNNEPALTKLVLAQANVDIPITITEKREQRHLLSGSENSMYTQWSEWSEWEPVVTTCSTLAWAKQGNNPSILSIIQDLTMPEEDINDAAIDVLAESLKNKSTIDVYKNKAVVLKSNINQCSFSLYGLPNKDIAERLEQKWQKKVTHQFFRLGEPLKKGKTSEIIYTTIKNTIEKNQIQPIKIDGLPRRSFIIALSKILTDYGYMPELVFQLGITSIKFTRENSVTRRQKGNFKMVLPLFDIAYGQGCINRMKNFMQPAWDKNTSHPRMRTNQFLKLIRERLAVMNSFRCSDLTPYGNIRLQSEKSAGNDEKNQGNIHLLNGLIFLVTTVEVLVRLYRQADGNIFPYSDQTGIASDAFPVAMAQARSLHLLLTGQITFTDFLGETTKDGYDATQHRAYYGAVTGKGTMDNITMMLEKLCAINQKYNASIPNVPEFQPFCEAYQQSNQTAFFIEGRSRLYFDLKATYGSGAESDEGSHNYSASEDSELDGVISFHVNN
jgi:hypothetical protein